MSTFDFKKPAIGTLIFGVASAPLLGKDANGMVNDLGKYTGLIASANSATSIGPIMMASVEFQLNDGSGKTVEAPARPVKPVVSIDPKG
jgi:hypothetical protein